MASATLAGDKTPQNVKTPRSYILKHQSALADKVRVVILLCLNLGVASHIFAYHYFGVKDVGHHDPGDLFWFLKYGVVRVGLIMVVGFIVSTVIFGRFFCGWVCHMGGWQEFGRWILYTVFRYKPKLMSSKVTRYMPVVVLGMFCWGVYNVWSDHGIPTHLQPDLSQRPVWEMAGVGPTVAVLLVYTVLMPLFFGSRAICRYVCPWTPLFRFLDKFAVGRVRKVAECVRCMDCSQVCAMGIDVSYEINEFGSVVSDDCIKCLRCVQACEHGTIKYAFHSSYPLKKVRALKVNYTSFVPEMILMACGAALAFLSPADAVVVAVPLGLCLGMSFIYLMHFVRRRMEAKINAGEAAAPKEQASGCNTCGSAKSCSSTPLIGEFRIIEEYKEKAAGQTTA